MAGLVGLTPSGLACIMSAPMLRRALSHLEALLVRALFVVCAYRIERAFAQAAKNAGISAGPGSLWDALTKPTRLELMQHLGFPA